MAGQILDADWYGRLFTFEIIQRDKFFLISNWNVP